VDTGLLAAGAASAFAGGIFLYVGGRISQRGVSSGYRLASRQFSIWWIGFGIATLSVAVERILAGFGALTASLAITTLYADLLFLCVAMWGLLGYLVFMYRGKHALVPLSIFYAGFYLALLFEITAALPSGFTVDSGTVNVTFSSAIDSPVVAVLILLLFIPEVVASVFYLSLAWYARASTARNRVLLVGGGILFFLFATSFLPSVGVLSGVLHTVVSGLLASMGAVLVYMAYFPPALLRARLGLLSISEEIHPPELQRAPSG
jgi:hypothetical protein